MKSPATSRQTKSAQPRSLDAVVSALPSWIFIDAVRYCIGRKSYQVGVTTEWVCANWKHLPEHSRLIIKQDVEEAFERDDRMRADEKCSSHYYPLGQDMDRKSWETVRELWRANEKAL